MLLKDNLRNFWCYMQVEAWFFWKLEYLFVPLPPTKII